MKAEIVAVGTELLLGDVVNGNAAWLGRELAAIGIDVEQTTVVGDNEHRIAAVLAMRAPAPTSSSSPAGWAPPKTTSPARRSRG